MTPSRLRSLQLPALAAVLGLLAASCAQVFAAEPNAAGEVVVRLDDYAFDPGQIEVRAGQEVTFVLRNVGEHAHEFMIGRDPVVNDEYLDAPVVEAFQEDFFEGIEVSVTGDGMPMNLTGAEMDMDMEGMEMSEGEEDHAEDETAGGDDHADGEMEDMEGMEMSEGEGDHAEDETAEGDDHAEEEGGEAGHGGMVMLDRVEETRLTLTIPEDRVGTWTIGCFQEDGAHYADGMQATLVVTG